MENGQDELPETLLELINSGDHRGFVLAMGHFAELKHGSMGTFPAIEAESGEIIITTDVLVLSAVCKTLPPRPMRAGFQLLYIDHKTGMAYPVLSIDDLARLETAKPFQTLTRARFDELSANSDKPFKWSPGLVSDGMTPEEFQDTLQAAVADLSATC